FETVMGVSSLPFGALTPPGFGLVSEEDTPSNFQISTHSRDAAPDNPISCKSSPLTRNEKPETPNPKPQTPNPPYSTPGTRERCEIRTIRRVEGRACCLP